MHDASSSRTTRLAVVCMMAVVGALAAFTTSAAATPTKTSPCNGCHSGVKIPVTATLVSVSGTTAKYNVSATGAYAIAVFSGSTKLTTINAASGTFSVTTGRTYTIYAVKGPTTGSGIGSTSVSPAAAPAPVPTPGPDVTAPLTTSNAIASYAGIASIRLTATDAGSGVRYTYYRLDGGAQTLGTAVTVTSPGTHTLEFWSVDVTGNAEAHHTVGFSVAAVSTKAPSSISIASSARSVYRRRPFVLSGIVAPGYGAELVTVWVQKPGSSRWSYSSARLTRALTVSALEDDDDDDSVGAVPSGPTSSWWYRYTAPLRGTYRFKASYAGDTVRSAARSTIIAVSVR